ncbi:MAG: transcription elongation factor GreA [Chitinophagaceae bacterium]|nr:MAG: transcription elongation factor GreA [Chitinophagaceae bacterium]
MQTLKQQLVLLRDDYALLKGYIRSLLGTNSPDQQNLVELEKELMSGSLVVEKKDFPADAVCLNSDVTVEDKKSGKKIRFKLVLPAQANLKLGRISVFAPIGMALIGYRKGNLVKWRMPGGEKELLILNVLHAPA